MPCPVFKDFILSSQCEESSGGIAAQMYVGLKEDLNAPLAVKTDDPTTYPAFVAPSSTGSVTPTFKTGKGLYKFDLKQKANSIKGSSLGARKRFKQTFSGVIEAVSPEAAEIARALNNLDFFIIVVDGERSQIMYSKDFRIEAPADGINTDTGVNPEDDRVTNLATLELQPVPYPNMFIETPTAGWDAFLASAQEDDDSAG